MQPFTTLTGVAAPLLQDDINTDQIAPVQATRLGRDDRGLLFQRARRRDDGSEDPDFILNRPQFREARILVAGHNFGCGSSREGAVWTMLANGIHCIVARSFADIYRENCLQNGLLPIELEGEAADALCARVVEADGSAPFTVDLAGQRITGPGGADIAFEVAPSDRMRLLEGLDDIGLTLKQDGDIAAFEKRAAREAPWLQQTRDARLEATQQ
jgi:3-isopropylmalate/(R)-2-methylmalate dehydratase small subunit